MRREVFSHGGWNLGSKCATAARVAAAEISDRSSLRSRMFAPGVGCFLDPPGSIYLLETLTLQSPKEAGSRSAIPGHEHLWTSIPSSSMRINQPGSPLERMRISRQSIHITNLPA
jgi:hypothetical protein